MKKFLNGIALILCVMSFCVIAGCSYANNSPAPAPDPIPGQAAAPILNPESGAVDYGDTVEIACATEGASIHYTTDGTAPTAESSIYTSPIAITGDTTIKAIAVKLGMTSSEVASSTYTIKKYTVTFDADGHGTAPDPVTDKHKGETITLSELTESGYTFDGWTDGENIFGAGTEYTIKSDVILKAKWIGWNDVTTPSFSVTDSAVDYGDTVEITCATSGADIYYTTDGTAPTSSSTKYTSPITITSDVTIKAIALKSGMNDSAVSEKAYTIKKYTVTFDADGHGTAPEPVTGKHKDETITLPAALTETGWGFVNWNDGTTDYDAGASYTVNGNVTIKAVWKDVTPPAAVTNLSAKCTASGTVKLTWINPSDADFAKVVITYDTDKKVEVLKTATPNNEATVTALTDGTEYTFTVNAYDNAGNVSSGVNKKCTPFLGTAYNATNNGGLEGYTNQTQGAVIKETWMETNGNLKIGGAEISKTSEVVVVPTGTVATVTMPDDSSWSSYYSGSDSYFKGVFLKDRKVKLDPFVMSQYQVTQKLYNEVMGNNPSSFNSSPYGTETQENRPVEHVTWYRACAFCNELTKKTFGATTDQCVYYSDEALTAPYTATDAGNKTTPYIAYNTTTKKWTKKGYRLPTEAEWEFAARGGDPNKAEWNYAFAGVQAENTSRFASGSTDANLGRYGWYRSNASIKTHEVGLKKKNTLNLYDMSGNVWELCYDWYNRTAGSNDSAYTVDGYVQNPVGASASGSSGHCGRGGSYFNSDAYFCAVSYRFNYAPDNSYDFVGFRVCRSTN